MGLVVSSVFWLFVSFAYSYDCGLWTQDCWNEVLATNVSYAAHRESSIFKIRLRKLIALSLLNQFPHVLINLENALALDRLDIGRCQSIFRVNSDTEVMVFLNNILLNVPLGVQRRVHLGVHNRVFIHRQRDCFHEEWKESKVGDALFQLLAQSYQRGRIHVV